MGGYVDRLEPHVLSPILPNGETEREARDRLLELVMPLVQQAKYSERNLHRRTDAWVLPASADPWLGREGGVETIFGRPVIWSPEERYGLFYEVPR